MEVTHFYDVNTRQTVITVTLDNIDPRLNSYNHRVLDKFVKALELALDNRKELPPEMNMQIDV